MEEIFGLPAHPLLVHGAVVFVPLTALGVVVVALSARARRGIGIVVVGFAAASFVLCLLAAESGESLEEEVDETELVEEHAELGERMPVIAGLMLLTTAAFVGADQVIRRRERNDGQPPSWAEVGIPALAAVAVLVAVVATVAVIDVGHSGATATWEDETGEGGEDEDEDEGDREGDGEGDGEGEDDEEEEGLAPASGDPGVTSLA